MLGKVIELLQKSFRDDELEKTLRLFESYVSSNSELYNDYLIISNTYKEIQREIRKNLFTEEIKDFKLARIRGSLLSLINDLEPLDLNDKANQLTENNSIDNSSDLLQGFELSLNECRLNFRLEFDKLKNKLELLPKIIDDKNSSLRSLIAEFKKTEIINLRIKSKVKNHLFEIFDNYSGALEALTNDISIAHSRVTNANILLIQAYFSELDEVEVSDLDETLEMVDRNISIYRRLRKFIKKDNIDYRELVRKNNNIELKTTIGRVVSAQERLINLLNQFIMSIIVIEDHVESMKIEIESR